ncbi:MAG: DUF1302 family protein, partial [Candidatus Binatia bacterium]
MRLGRTAAAIAGGLLAFPAVAVAYYLDRDETLQVLGRVYSEGAVRTVDSSGFTFPRTPAGHFVQHRNLLEAELAHELDRLLPHRPRWLHGVGYRLRYKGVYEGLYDYGPREYSEQEEVNPPAPFGPPAAPEGRTVNRTAANRQVLGLQNELWNAYAEASAGPVFFRVGRQDLSWGETDGFRLLDMIEPLDNRFGFALVEDLDDRRIPLWMARTTVALSWRSALLSNLTFDGFLVPGSIEEQEAPLSPRGSPFAAPAPPSFLGRAVTRPEANMRGSRGGGRLIGTLYGTTTVSVAHYLTWNDAPAVRLHVRRVELVDGAPVPDAALEFAFYRQQVSGGSLTTQISPLDTVLRAEAAMFWD